MSESYFCHCPCFAGIHYEARICRTVKELKRKAVQEHLNTESGVDEYADERRLDERERSKYINAINRGVAK